MRWDFRIVDLTVLQALRIPSAEQTYTAKDSMLYALALGFGEEPSNPVHLQFVYESGLRAVPSACVVLSHPGMWVKAPELKIDWVKLVHAEQSFEIKKPLSPFGSVRGEYSINAVEDRGREKGAALHLTKNLFDLQTNELIAVVTSVYLLRGDGGQGGFGTTPPSLEPLPIEEPALAMELKTLPQSALLYRLSGDMNPIHADPDVARLAGFPRPILQGLCSMGIATRALIESLANGNPDRIKSVSLRFSKVVMPGETLRMEIYKTDSRVRFRARNAETGTVVLDRGTAVLTD
jgi:acyl dehydratase